MVNTNEFCTRLGIGITMIVIGFICIYGSKLFIVVSISGPLQIFAFTLADKYF